MPPISRVYADHNASAPLLPEAREAMLRALELPANASSVHAEGRRAKGIMESARREIARLVNGDPELIVFTSGATEAIATLCKPRPGIAFKFLATEHSAVVAQGQSEDAIGVNHNGIVSDFDCESDDLVAIQLANSETGVLQPMPELNARVFRDAVQIAGKMPLDIMASGADVICISSHKIGGPQGAAAIIARSADHLPEALIAGGGQEKGRRGGTENVSAIAGFGAAAKAASLSLDDFQARTATMRDQLEAGLHDIANTQGFELVIHGAGAARLPNTSCFSFRGLEASTALMAADIGGISLSSGSACSSGKVGKSHVLAAMGVDNDLAKAALRVSFGWSSQPDDAGRILEFFSKELPRLLA
jgi:cysteine desulfurase